MHPIDYNCPFHGLFMNFSAQIIACCAYRCSYLRFSYPLRPRAESATFLFATMVDIYRVTSAGMGQWLILKSLGRLSCVEWRSYAYLLTDREGHLT